MPRTSSRRSATFTPRSSQIKGVPQEPEQVVLRHRRRPEGHPDAPALRGQGLPVVRGLRRARDRSRQDDVAAARARGRALRSRRAPSRSAWTAPSRPCRPSTRPVSREVARNPAGPGVDAPLCRSARPVADAYRPRGNVDERPARARPGLALDPHVAAGAGRRSCARSRGRGPVPASLVVKNGSNTCDSAPGAMPGPVSSMARLNAVGASHGRRARAASRRPSSPRAR